MRETALILHDLYLAFLLAYRKMSLMNLIANTLPYFETLQAQQHIDELQQCIEKSKIKLDTLANQKQLTWQNLMLPLAEIDESIARLWGPVSHLSAVCDCAEIRPVYEQGVQLMTAWGTWVAQHQGIYQAMTALLESKAFAALKQEQQTAIQHTLRDFRLAGSALTGKDKTRYADISMRLAELGTLFSKHVLDATQAFSLLLTEQSQLGGLPDSIVASAAQRAQEDGQAGWLFTLDIPSYLPFMQYAKSSALREKMYKSYVSRASAGDWDNSPVIDELLLLRQEKAQLLGFEHYAAYSLADKMAENVTQATDFLRDLAAKSQEMAKNELKTLKNFAKTTLNIQTLQAWDIPYASECLRQAEYAISQDALKPWFPEHHVKQGLFTLAERLYNIRIQRGQAEVWADGVEYYDVLDAQGAKKAGFFLDPYARKGKRGGAWMDECLVAWRLSDGSKQYPVAYLVCNFDAPVGDKPALWTHDEVITLFHEFGHGLHHMMTNIETREVSGINGVPWDAVELPSQFMENFCWEREVLDLFAKHYETGESLPQDMFDKMLAAKHFQAGLQMLRQVEFSLFDLLLHSQYEAQDTSSVQDVLDEVRQEVAVLHPPACNVFQNSFSHIFAGGYAAGYYSYKWAEVLSADVYAAFEAASGSASAVDSASGKGQQSIINASIASKFLEALLSRGGSRDMMESYVDFRGKEPTVDALLRHNGLAKA
ncbi:MAG: M3 family metallopeptidase [Mariprofundaceae bacterium]|nr:M3 family metallopeptidase [Mariprofundaceae bacterium]